MQLYTNKMDCYGCAACFSICPKNAIEMKEDEQGFLYPSIDSGRCVNCGLCQKACQISKEKELVNEKCDECFGFKAEDEVRENSSSGGVFVKISDTVLAKGGSVCGVKYDEHYMPIHSIATTTEERDLFCGSKYIQSSIGDCFKIIEKSLRNGEYIFFTGTPCQVAGLKNFLTVKSVNIEKLLTMDLVCHGSPSRKVWREYKTSLERRFNSRLTGYSFRDKKVGWRGYHIRAEFENRHVESDTDIVRSFVICFSEDLCLRPSCYYCPYCSLKRTGDISIGDFWGIEKIDPDYVDNKGINMLIGNTVKGKSIISEIKNDNTQLYCTDQ